MVAVGWLLGCCITGTPPQRPRTTTQHQAKVSTRSSTWLPLPALFDGTFALLSSLHYVVAWPFRSSDNIRTEFFYKYTNILL